ncbi:helicase DnaB [Staphylococcus muscae]|uniref:Chromosome replication initiation/membrane attachment protein n=1 Tax=Staphylococcus muscae TaxID=1294 RepID=A0A240C2N8_9STAP|nr:DnaD domain protein [Staphylococcus muscae]AVQ32949.1 helicase DnaB [Staphylococcus muscae]PNZ05138.1 helicase DnaB [Staphylococcus muscae]GGA89547.1 helicase DnaB [Staphylococcus muscae]SNW02165.1 chromosome replication initiation/membrane attachment protein [Staphylococcus muscae]
MSLSMYANTLRPHDGFQVIQQFRLQPLHDEILSRLFTPLIGAQSVGIYHFLSQFSMSSAEEGLTHYTVMSELKINLMSFREYADLLEGIGLMRTYVRHSDETTQFIYELLPPPSPDEFFNDPMLSIYFYQIVGNQRYHQLKSHFIIQTVDTTGYVDVTKKFTDVFKVPKQSFYQPEKHLAETEYNGVDLTDVSFDFDLLADMLQTHYISKEILTEPTKTLIVQLATLYRIAPDQMKTLILKSLNSDQTLSIIDLRKQAQTHFLNGNQQTLPELQRMNATSDTVNQGGVEHEDVSVESWEDWYHLMDNTSPVVMLTSYGGSEPPLYQKRMIEELMEREGFNFGVINILLQYVMQKIDNNLPEKYVYSVASTWKKSGVVDAKTAHQKAMEIQRNEEKAQEKRKQPQRQNYSKGTVYEEKPRWMTHPEEFKSKEEDLDVLERDREAFLKELQQSRKAGDE